MRNRPLSSVFGLFRWGTTSGVLTRSEQLDLDTGEPLAGRAEEDTGALESDVDGSRYFAPAGLDAPTRSWVAILAFQVASGARIHASLAGCEPRQLVAPIGIGGGSPVTLGAFQRNRRPRDRLTGLVVDNAPRKDALIVGDGCAGRRCRKAGPLSLNLGQARHHEDRGDETDLAAHIPSGRNGRDGALATESSIHPVRA